MSTRLTQFGTGLDREPTGYEGTDTPEDFSIPSCTMEDADRAVFDLFDKELPLQFVQHDEVKRIPVIFATGERFAVLNRKEPLRDKNKTLILPLISIMRTGINQQPDNGHGPGQMHPTKLKIKVSPESDTYKRLVNKLGLVNQDNVASNSHIVGAPGEGTLPGTVGSRRASARGTETPTSGPRLSPDLLDNIYEIITMPPVKYYQATYNITIWSQFFKQMNDIITVIMSTYQNNYGRTFRLETSKGYWFVGYISSEFSSGENFDDLTDSERLIKQSFDIKVNAYLIMPDYPGSPNGLRRKVSAPNIEFKVEEIKSKPYESLSANVASGSPLSYILDDLSTVGDGIPGQALGSNEAASGLARVGENLPESSVIDDSNLSHGAPVVGGFSGSSSNLFFHREEVDPFTGKRKKIIVAAVKQRPDGSTQGRQGETVYREALVVDIDDF